jgi:hypothetical protein
MDTASAPASCAVDGGDAHEHVKQGLLEQLHVDLEVFGRRLSGGEGEGDGKGGDKRQKQSQMQMQMQTQSQSQTQCLIDVLDRTALRGGRAHLEGLLGAPLLADAAALRARQRTVRERGELAVAADLDATWEVLARNEADARWLLRMRMRMRMQDGDEGDEGDEGGDMAQLCRSATFHVWPLSLLNTRSPAALSCLAAHKVVLSPLLGLLSPLLYFVVPFVVLCVQQRKWLSFPAFLARLCREAGAAFAAGLRSLTQGPVKSAAVALGRGLSAVLSFVMFVQGTWSSVETARSTQRACSVISRRVAGALAFFQAAADAVQRCDRSDAATSATSATSPVRLLDATTKCKLGAALQVAACMAEEKREARADAVRLLARVYELDAHASICRVRAARGWCWAEFVPPNQSRPILSLRGVVHPCVAPERAVANDWTLDGVHALVTGPNAGGKSTLMKAALCSVLMAQTLTLAPCVGGIGEAACRLTPFAVVSSHMNVADQAGASSLFQAELLRAQRVLGLMAGLRPERDEKAFVVMDEMFSSTNAVEGLAAAAACALGMAAHPSALCVLSTHHLQLCSLLRRRAPGRFLAFGMPVHVHAATGAIHSHPYRLQKGVCRQFVALELLRGAGFDSAIVQTAIALKTELIATVHAHTAPKTPPEAIDAPKAPKSPKASKAIKAIKALDDVKTAPEAPEAPETPETPEAPDDVKTAPKALDEAKSEGDVITAREASALLTTLVAEEAA